MNITYNPGVNLVAALQQAEDNGFACCSSASSSFANAAEIRLVYLDEPIENRRFLSKIERDDLAEKSEYSGRRVFVRIGHIRSNTGRRSGNEKMQQVFLLR